ncbi:MAG: tRNA lysidine(34) synthetase TilS [Pyrinomonadaceae bacterium]
MMTNNPKKGKPARSKLSAFATKLLAEWRRLELPLSEATVVVAVSGGADSSALFLALDELIAKEKLRLKLLIAHLDHGLRQASGKDAKWVSALAKQLGYQVVTSRVRLATSATKGESNLEQAARKTRYKFLQTTATRNRSNFVLTAHTLDDQAETILMRLLRGSAAEGLSGTSSSREIERGSKVKLVRPLLSWARRVDTESYCRLRQIDFRLDEMNDDEAFSRVRVRKHLLPLMKSFNNRIVEALSRTATLLSEDATALSDEAKRLLELAHQHSGKTAGKNRETKLSSVSVDILLKAPAAVRRRALREWILRSRGDLRRLEMVHLLAVEGLLKGGRGGRVAELPEGMKVTRTRGMLELSAKKGLKKA